ncbi:MAG: ferric reductase [Parcubacteria group bacterium]|nr:MAG: ferric reductase [Parcubacteria group bacterium]
MGKFIRTNFGLLVIGILTIIPLLRWLFLLPLDLRFYDVNSISTSLGQLTGLAGMTLFSINLILTSRLKIFDKLYLGINNVYKRHSQIGALSFCLLLFHPLLLAVKYLQVSVHQAALFLLPGQEPAINFGIFALVLMMLLLLITFYVKLRYHYWKISHKFLVAAFILVMLHTLFITSDISRDIFLRYYILILVFIGLVAGFYRAGLSKYWNNNLSYRVIQVNRLNDQVWEIIMEPRGQKIVYEPGQFVFLRFLSPQLSSESHPFSIASSPDEANLRVIIKSLGDYTARLDNLDVGDLVSVEGPFGRFNYKRAGGKKQLWLAGGIGITPFLGMAQSLRPDDGYQVDLYYCVSTMDEAIYWEKLSQLATGNNNFRIFSWCSAQAGRISTQKIAEQSAGLAGKEVFLCGPDSFMSSLRQQLIAQGLSRQNIHGEQFKFL